MKNLLQLILVAMTVVTACFAQAAPPFNVKIYGAATVGVGGSTTLDLTINNTNNATNFTAVTGTDILPADQVISTPNGLISACTPGSTLGPLTAVAGTNTITIGTSTILANGACTVQVNVTGTAPGALPNTFNASDAVAGAGNAAIGVLTVLAIAPPTIAKAFGAPVIGVGGTTTLTFTITAANPLTNVNFTDTRPAGLVVATPSGLTNSCGGVAFAGANAVSLTGGSFAAAGSCTISVNVTAVTAGTQVNSVTVSDAVTGVGNTSTATLTVALPPTITKAFAGSTLQLLGPGDTTALTFTITNPNAATTLTGIAFTDILPSGLAVASPSGLTSNCGGVVGAASNAITLTGGSIVGGLSCSITVNVTATAIGVFTNTTSTITATGGLVGNAATATITVNDLFVFWFFAESGGGRP